MTTRFYLPFSGSPPSSPSVSTGWMYSSSGFTRYPTAFDKAGAESEWQYNTWPGTTDEVGYCCRSQYVSPPLDVDQTISGTVSAVMGVWESSTLADVYLCYSVRVLQGDTSTERGVLKAPIFADTEATTSGHTRIVNAVAVTSVNALAGDRIVIELGHRFVTPSAGAYAALFLGNPADTDLALTSGVDPTNACPWLELSTTITFYAPQPASAAISFTTADTAFALSGELSNLAALTITTADTAFALSGVVESMGALQIITDDTAFAISAAVENVGSITFTTDNTAFALTGDSGLPVASISFTTADAVIAIDATINNTAALAFTTAAAVVSVSGTTTATPPTEYFSVTVRDAITGAKLTGLTNQVMISAQRDEDGHRFDFTDNQFRAAAAVPTLAMDEDSASNSPGRYSKPLQVISWTGDITITIEYNDGTRINTWTASSVEYLAGVRVKTGSRAAAADVPSAAANAAAAVAADFAAVIDSGAQGDITKERFYRAWLAYIAGKRRGLTPGSTIPTLEEYLQQDGVTVGLSFAPTDASGNGTPTIGD